MASKAGNASSLNLRPTFDRQKQTSVLQSEKSSRHKGYLKNMLVGKFMQRTKLDTGESLLNKNGDPKPVTHQKLIKVSAIVSKEFDRFIEQQTFTQKNLKTFESDLIAKLKDMLDKDGVSLVEFKSMREMTNNLSLPQITSPENSNDFTA